MATILLIDDDELLRTVAAEVIRRAGHTVIEARNGKEGLNLFPHVNADLVITDIVMPEVEGLEVLMTLRNWQPPVKIIAMSGGARGNSADYLRTATALGAAKVLAKPFSNATLMAAIDELMVRNPLSAKPRGQPGTASVV